MVQSAEVKDWVKKHLVDLPEPLSAEFNRIYGRSGTVDNFHAFMFNYVIKMAADIRLINSGKKILKSK